MSRTIQTQKFKKIPNNCPTSNPPPLKCGSHIWKPPLRTLNFQLKDHGQVGVPGVHAQQMQDVEGVLAQDIGVGVTTTAISRVQEAHPRAYHVEVR